MTKVNTNIPQDAEEILAELEKSVYDPTLMWVLNELDDDSLGAILKQYQATGKLDEFFAATEAVAHKSMASKAKNVASTASTAGKMGAKNTVHNYEKLPAYAFFLSVVIGARGIEKLESLPGAQAQAVMLAIAPFYIVTAIVATTAAGLALPFVAFPNGVKKFYQAINF